MSPTERAVSPGHFFDPQQTQLREFAYDRPLVARTDEAQEDNQ